MEPSKLEVKPKSSRSLDANPCSGSATGNPRNKVALQPGHSLMDWIRLGNSGKDLTSVGGRLIEVTEQELAEHCDEQNAWIAIRGKVYNIAPYLTFHPGGVPEMMKGAGKDATDLFNEIHPWVNYESILQKCLVGKLVKSKQMATKEDFEEAFFVKPTSTVSEPTTTTCIDEQMMESNIKMDWCQTSHKLCLIYFTKTSTPQIIVTYNTHVNLLRIVMCVRKRLHVFCFKLLNKVMWPCLINVNTKIGKVIIELEKKSEGLWETYGKNEKENCLIKANTNEIDEYYKVKIVNAIQLTHNTRNYILKFVDCVCMWVPLGHDIRLRAVIHGVDTAKQYTPIVPYLPHSEPVQHWHHDYVCVMVKLYEDGAMTPWLFDKIVGDVIELGGISGVFDINKLSYVTELYLIAAGSGLSPMIKLIMWALQEKQQVNKISLLFCNRSEKDIIWREEFDRLAQKESRFEIKYCLSQAGPDWTGLTGRVTDTMLDNFLPCDRTASPDSPAKFYITACGPIEFTELIQGKLNERGYGCCSFCFLG